MAFRRPEENRSSPSLGYRLSSNRQPGVEIANNRMPSKPMPRFSPEDMPMPPEAMPMPRYERPIGIPGMGNYQQMGRQSTDPRERYIANTQGGHPNMSQYGYPMPNSGMFRDLMEALPIAEGIEQAAVDPSDYRTILKMIEAGLNPDDYMAANRGGIASLMR